jgi:hypothetical protein
MCVFCEKEREYSKQKESPILTTDEIDGSTSTDILVFR